MAVGGGGFLSFLAVFRENTANLSGSCQFLLLQLELNTCLFTVSLNIAIRNKGLFTFSTYRWKRKGMISMSHLLFSSLTGASSARLTPASWYHFRALIRVLAQLHRIKWILLSSLTPFSDPTFSFIFEHCSSPPLAKALCVYMEMLAPKSHHFPASTGSV